MGTAFRAVGCHTDARHSSGGLSCLSCSFPPSSGRNVSDPGRWRWNQGGGAHTGLSRGREPGQVCAACLQGAQSWVCIPSVGLGGVCSCTSDRDICTVLRVCVCVCTGMSLSESVFLNVHVSGSVFLCVTVPAIHRKIQKQWRWRMEGGCRCKLGKEQMMEWSRNTDIRAHTLSHVFRNTQGGCVYTYPLSLKHIE